MWRACTSAGWVRSTWMMWKPNGDSTGSEIMPGLSENAARSNSGTITPRRNQFSEPP